MARGGHRLSRRQRQLEPSFRLGLARPGDSIPTLSWPGLRRVGLDPRRRSTSTRRGPSPGVALGDDGRGDLPRLVRGLAAVCERWLAPCPQRCKAGPAFRGAYFRLHFCDQCHVRARGGGGMGAARQLAPADHVLRAGGRRPHHGVHDHLERGEYLPWIPRVRHHHHFRAGRSGSCPIFSPGSGGCRCFQQRLLHRSLRSQYAHLLFLHTATSANADPGRPGSIRPSVGQRLRLPRERGRIQAHLGHHREGEAHPAQPGQPQAAQSNSGHSVGALRQSCLGFREPCGRHEPCLRAAEQRARGGPPPRSRRSLQMH
mmetsp:Transcript_65881/g.176530  ORF Transcript_65881/g.176530 Transcript_65881/m.176530 type:complete len:315 (+) Transcript_65881:856-1800(+)